MERVSLPLLAAMAVGCQSNVPVPEILDLVPASGSNLMSTPVEIRGSGLVLVSVTELNTGVVTASFTADLEGNPLMDVRWVDAARLTATVPTGLTPGLYSLTVRDDAGRAATLADAFTVCGPGIACGGGADAGPNADAGPSTDASPAVCGNGVIEAGEQCDPPGVSCDPACQISPNACPQGVGTLVCGSVVTGNNGMPGSTTVNLSYSCLWNDDGPEVAYTFVSPSDRLVSFELTQFTAELDLRVLSGAPPCDPLSTCAAKGGGGQVGNGVPEVAVFEAAPGEPYYAVIDGLNGATGDYTLEVLCSPPIPGSGTCADPFVIDAAGPIDLFHGMSSCGQGDDSAPSAVGGECLVGAPGDDVTYRLDLGFDAVVTLDLWEVDGPDAIDVVLYVLNDCSTGAATLYCDDDVAGQFRHARLDLTLTAGTYWVVVDASTGGSATCGNYRLTVLAQ